MSSGGIYDSGIGYAVKDQCSGTTPYSALFPKHGVPADFHFQKGKNMPCSLVQRDYDMPGFTSSPGMYGKLCFSSCRQLADWRASTASKLDMSSYDFSHSECAVTLNDHGGSVFVDDAKGTGTVFVISLPAGSTAPE